MWRGGCWLRVSQLRRSPPKLALLIRVTSPASSRRSSVPLPASIGLTQQRQAPGKGFYHINRAVDGDAQIAQFVGGCCHQSRLELIVMLGLLGCVAEIDKVHI